MQNTLRENWRAGYAERCKSGSEGSSAKPNTAMCHGRVVLTLLFIAGTIEDESGERQSVRVNREQVVADPRSMQRADNLHRIARHEMETLLDRTIGIEWRDIRAQQLAGQVPEPAPVDHQNDIQSLAAELGLEL